MIAGALAAVAATEGTARADGPTLAQFAGYAGDAYAFTRDPHWKPRQGCSVVEEVKRTATSGFQGIAMMCDGKLIVSFTGTKFTERDEMDMAADRALAKISALPLIELPQLRHAERDLPAHHWQADPKSSRYTFECLAAKMHEAQQLFANAITKSRAKKSDVYVVGHSLGGFLAEYVGALEGVTAHAFNPGPGARHVVPASAHGQTVTGHHREWDLVSGALGTRSSHVGKMCSYAGLNGASAPAAAANQNDTHSIETFAKDLAAGLHAKKCE